MTGDVRRRIPRTDAVLEDPRLVAASETLGHALVKESVVAAQRRARRGDIVPEAVAEAAVSALPRSPSSLRPVLNATGVVLHTNLGRAPLSPAAVSAAEEAAGCTDVEYELSTGRRGGRGHGAADALAAACPAASGVHVVNNGAAALALAATALAAGREIVVSRGEMVEIGDGFRIPELVASTGARLREVGATNRTKTSDYADAVGPGTGLILKVHTSNFRVEGFASSVPVRELAGLGVPVVADIGSGLLDSDTALPGEPDAASMLRAGATLVTASGDKLLGGPQAGLLLGDAGVVQRLRRHPLARALRVDKLTLAALEATLRGPETPTAAALHADTSELWDRADALAARLIERGVDALAVRSEASVGGGGAPGVSLPSAAVSLPARLCEGLRRGDEPVVARVERDRCLLDLRAVPAEADGRLYDAVLATWEDREGRGASGRCT